MKLHTIGIVFLFLVLLTSCNVEQPLECDPDQHMEEGVCVDNDGNHSNPPEVNINNPIQLNTGNTDGWTLYKHYKTTPTMDIADGVITFTQADNDEDSIWARKLTYGTLSFDATMQYTLRFTVTGTIGEEFTLQLYTNSTDLLVDEQYTLDGSNQTIEIIFQTREDVVGIGIFVLGLGTFENDSTLTIRNISITEEEHIPTVINILFIGNSFTYYNDMPTMLNNMAVDAGYHVHVEQIAYGGFELIRYVTLGSSETQEVINKLNEREWDYVVLQEQSNKPATNKSEFLQSVGQLNQLIVENGAQTVLYSTWSYRDGTTKLDSTGYTYTEFYQALTSAYIEAENTYDTLRAPVGTVFYNMTMDGSTIDLIANDDFHPSLEGSYVAAFTFYTLIFGNDNDVTYKPGAVTIEERDIIQSYVLDLFPTE